MSMVMENKDTFPLNVSDTFGLSYGLLVSAEIFGWIFGLMFYLDFEGHPCNPNNIVKNCFEINHYSQDRFLFLRNETLLKSQAYLNAAFLAENKTAIPATLLQDRLDIEFTFNKINATIFNCVRDTINLQQQKGDEFCSNEFSSMLPWLYLGAVGIHASLIGIAASIALIVHITDVEMLTVLKNMFRKREISMSLFLDFLVYQCFVLALFFIIYFLSYIHCFSNDKKLRHSSCDIKYVKIFL